MRLNQFTLKFVFTWLTMACVASLALREQDVIRKAVGRAVNYVFVIDWDRWDI